MGNKQTKSKPEPSQPVRPTLADSSDEEPNEPQIKHINEAQVFIQLQIFHELPHGALNIQHFTVDPTKKVIDIKESLATILGIPSEHMQIYRHRNPQTEMPNHRSLNELVVPDHEQLRVRDSRHIYTNPI